MATSRIETKNYTLKRGAGFSPAIDKTIQFSDCPEAPILISGTSEARWPSCSSECLLAGAAHSLYKQKKSLRNMLFYFKHESKRAKTKSHIRAAHSFVLSYRTPSSLSRIRKLDFQSTETKIPFSIKICEM